MKYFEEKDGQKYVVGDVVDFIKEDGTEYIAGNIQIAKDDGTLRINFRDDSLLLSQVKSIKLRHRSPLYELLSVYEDCDDEDTALEKEIINSCSFSADTKLKIIRKIEKARIMVPYPIEQPVIYRSLDTGEPKIDPVKITC